MTVYPWIFLDADGTLFNYERAEAVALQATFSDQALVFEARYATLYQHINHQIWLDFEAGRINAHDLRAQRFERLFTAAEIEADVLAFSAQYLLNLSLQTALMPGAQEVVASLAVDHHLAIITNGLSDVQRPRLARSSIHTYFSAVFISEEMGVAKPDPAYFVAVFAALAAHPQPPQRSGALVVGDSLTSDIQGGRCYGLATCWYNPAQKPLPEGPAPDFEIRHLEELLQIV